MTVIVAAAGVALGPRRGFAVGALAAIASNLFLGQGPHTPWQMLAWGGCGLLAGVLRPLLRRRRVRRLLLVLGMAFGTVMDLWLWFAFYPHTWAALLARLAAGVAFNVAHALGNLVLALVAGPELRRVSTGTDAARNRGRLGMKLLAGSRRRRGRDARRLRPVAARATTAASPTRGSPRGRRSGSSRPAAAPGAPPISSTGRAARPTSRSPRWPGGGRRTADDVLARLRAHARELVNATIWTVLALGGR